MSRESSELVEGSDQVALEQASRWMARLWSDDASDADRAACLRWRRECLDHERAWQRLQAIDDRLHALPAHAARSELFEAPVGSVSRRRLLQWSGAVLLLGGVITGLPRTPQWQRQFADYATGVGEIREVALPDGTRLVLNTATSVDIRFDPDTRWVRLIRGEILVTSGSAMDERPFGVVTREGAIYPIGTRFSIHQDDAATRVAVYEGRVELEGSGSRGRVPLDAGQQATMTGHRVSSPGPLDLARLASFQGRLVAERMRVGDFAAALERYRHGVVRCAPEVADLRVTGVFSLHDTDRALTNLSDALPVAVVYRTPLWVTIQPASGR